MNRSRLIFFIVGIAVVVLVSRLARNTGQPLSQATSPSASSQVLSATLGTRTKTTGCQVQDKLPDTACSPGAVFSGVTKEQVCVQGYSSSVRDVSTAEKNQVYTEYGILTHTTGEYEVDHLISLELGGSNDISNLWPEAANPVPGFHQKDVVENYLHDQVCKGQISLGDAQKQIATGWLSVYLSLHPANPAP